MTRQDNGHFADKHPPGRKIIPEIEHAVRQAAPDREISCSRAFEIVKAHGVSPEEVGFTLDVIEWRIVKCQMGLFGYKPRKSVIRPAESVPPVLKEAISKSLVAGKLPCQAAWEIARNLDLKKMAVSSACEALKVKVSSCQLGAF